MPVKIIPEYGLPFIGDGAQAEKKTLEFLKLLPTGYYVIRECKVDPTVLKKSRGSFEDRPDFVVVGPTIGVVILEVKDWNIRANRFEYLNDYQVRKIDLVGNIKIIDNPYHKADEYLHAVIGVLSKNQQKVNTLWVCSFAVYPKLTRTEFENLCAGMQKNNPQQRFIFDPQRTLFQDDLERYRDTPLKLLELYASNEARLRQRSMGPYTEQQVNLTVYRLVPSEIHVGGLPNDADAEKNLALLDDKQQQWAFSEALAGKTYLADVAGSGKTNVLLSRAIFKAKQHIITGGCRILIVTYSKALKLELERIFHAKIADDPYYDYYCRAIHLFDMVSLMEEIVKKGLGNSNSALELWRKQVLVSHQKSEYVDDKLPERCIDLLMENRKAFQVYDYLFIDEIQDFSTWFLEIALELLTDRKNIFTVGDIGQKLFDRELDWSEFDIVKQRAELQSRFLMYRSPQLIAKLAWKFLISDRFIEEDLKEEGYRMDIKPKSPFMYKPVFISQSSEEASLQHVLDDLHSHLHTVRPKQILCIGLKDKMLGKLYQVLTSASVAVRWATEVSSPVGDYVVLADYMEAKGLERDFVYIMDADHLAVHMSPFASQEQVKKEIRRDRIKLFVALTRAIREVRLYYIDRHQQFIRELLQIQSTL